MDEDGDRYTSNPYRMNRNPPIQHSKLHHGSSSYPKPKHRGYQFHGYEDEEDNMADVEGGDYDDDEDDEEEVVEHRRGGNLERETDDESDEDEYEKHPKKQKLKSLSSYDFAPSTSKRGCASLDWTEHETFLLLDAWGDKFLKRGRKSLLAEEWQEVAEEVSQKSKIERTEAQCRTRLDTLRKKYKKEKIKLNERGGNTSKWVYFSRMDLLMSGLGQRQSLSCGMDSGEYVFMNPKAYLDLANGMDELRDSPLNSDDDCERDDGASFRLLADSIDKFGEIYEKVENGKRKQMVELENMRMDFERDVEMQKRGILERAEEEIARIRGAGNDDDDLSAENLSD